MTEIALPEEMAAIEIIQPGGPDMLQPTSVPLIRPTGSDILIEVKAAGVNRPDVLQRMGLYDPPKTASPLPGLEVAGTVVALGENASQWKVGDKVCALTPGGGYASHCLTHEGHALRLPKDFSWVEAAALPENYFTVWHNVFQRGGLKAGETFLVHGGSSGIGTTAIQLAKAFGAQVIATAGSDGKCTRCKEIGADYAINYKTEDYVSRVKEITNKRGANLILDMVGGDYIERNYSAAAFDGRIVQIAFLGGPVAEVNFAKLMMKRLTHTGSTLRPQSDEAKTQMAEELLQHVWPLLDSGQVKPIIDTVYPLKEASAAHAHMETSKHVGKIMLEVEGF